LPNAGAQADDVSLGPKNAIRSEDAIAADQPTHYLVTGPDDLPMGPCQATGKDRRPRPDWRASRRLSRIAFVSRPIVTGTRIKARTHTVSSVREEAEIILTGSRHRRTQPIKPEEGYAMKTNAVCPGSLSAPAVPYMGRRSSARGVERLLLLFSFLGSLFCTDRGSDE
jgi:hypothetical protein